MSAPDQAEARRLIEDGRHLVPAHMWSAVEGYYLHGYAPGNFLTALLSNDLMEAMGRADDENASRIREWCQFLYNYTPGGSYGSPSAVERWLAQFAEQVTA
jgi:hypothetical protein